MKKEEFDTEEFDTSDLAWVLYRLMYGINQNVSKINGRKFIEISKENNAIKLSGDTDFNFGKGWSYSIENKYKGYLDSINNDYKDTYESQIKICQKLYHSILNISLMPQSGNLQRTKAGIGNDRLDTFLWALNSYYTDESNLLFNYSSFYNMETLKKYLDHFKTISEDEPIYNYCLSIYGIKSHELIDDLVNFGKEAVDSPEKVIRYMTLAYRFWRQKLRLIKSKLNNENGLPEEEKSLIENAIKNAEESLNEWFDAREDIEKQEI